MPAPQARPLVEGQGSASPPGGIPTPLSAVPSAAMMPPASPGASASAPSSTRVLWQGPGEVKLGESFAVTVNVSSGADLRGLPMEIAYPSNLLDVVAIAEGSFLKQGDSATSFVQANNPTTGRISIGILRNDSTGATGEGSVAQIQFKVKAAGNIQLSFTSVRPIGMGEAVTLDTPPVLNIIAK
jgi:general secretion pathway protein D